jgi:hypothetical protein
MPCVGFEPKIPAFERAKTVHALDHAAIVIGGIMFCYMKNDYYILWAVTRCNLVHNCQRNFCLIFIVISHDGCNYDNYSRLLFDPYRRFREMCCFHLQGKE